MWFERAEDLLWKQSSELARFYISQDFDVMFMCNNRAKKSKGFPIVLEVYHDFITCDFNIF